MTDLTEQWKKWELPNGIYYVELLGGNTMIAYMYKVHPYKNKTVYRVKAFNGIITKYQMKSVLYKVPTYEEYLASEKYNKHLEEVIKIYERKDKQATETSISYNELLEENKELKEILERHKKATAKAQIRSCDLEIINTQLKELLKRVVNATVFYHEIKTASVVDYGVWYNIANEINQALGEDK